MRVSKIATGTGDKGQTSLFDGSRTEKYNLIVDAYGEVDELDAVLGLAGAAAKSRRMKEAIRQIQRELFTLKADLATPMTGRRKIRRIQANEVKAIDERLDGLEASLPELHRFIANGGTPLAAALQHARAVARRAERAMWQANDKRAALNPEALVYMNRLSDYLFLLARKANLDAGVDEEEMRPLG